MFLYIGSKFQKLFVCSRNSDGALGRKKKNPTNAMAGNNGRAA